jgi:hypothetical protein
MAYVPSLPSTGQPIDTSYVYEIVQSLISINSELSNDGNSTIDNGSGISSLVKTNNINIVAKTVSVKLPEIVGPGQSTTIEFGTNTFTKNPIVIANLFGSDKAQLILTISNVTTSSFTLLPYCLVKGSANYKINFIAIGV